VTRRQGLPSAARLDSWTRGMQVHEAGLVQAAATLSVAGVVEPPMHSA
jgi:hypothetical protein